MAATTAILLAATSAVGLYGAQAEQAKQLSKDLEGASPLVKSTIDNLTKENLTLKAANKSLEKDKSTLAKEKSDALSKLVAEERARQSITQKLVATSPAEEAFRKANNQIIGRAAETIIAANKPSERVAEVLRSPASGLFRRGTIQQLFQRVLVAEGMTETQAVAAAVPEEAAPVQPQEAAPAVQGQPEDEDGAGSTSDPGSSTSSRRESDASAPAAAAVLSPATQALIQAERDAEETLDITIAEARRKAVPGTNVDGQPEVVAAREALRLAKEAAKNALGPTRMGPVTDGLGQPPMKGGAKLAGTYDDFAQLWLDAISQALSGVADEKEAKVTEKAQGKRDSAAALAATAFQTAINRIVERVKRDRAPKDATFEQLTPEQTAEIAPKKKVLDDVVEQATAAATEASSIKTDAEWTAFSSKLTLKEQLPVAYSDYAAAVDATAVKKPLSQRLGLAVPKVPFTLPKFTFSRPAPAPAPETRAPRSGSPPRASSVLSSLSGAPAVAPAAAPVVAPPGSPAALAATAAEAISAANPAEGPAAAAAKAAAAMANSSLKDAMDGLDRLEAKHFQLFDRISKLRAEGKEIPMPVMRAYVLLDRSIKSKRLAIKNRWGVDPEAGPMRLEDARFKQEEALETAIPVRKPTLTPRKRFGGVRKKTLRKRRGLHKRNV